MSSHQYFDCHSSLNWKIKWILKSIIESANLAWNKAFNSGSVKTLAGLYADNAIISPGNEKALTGRDEIEQLFMEIVKNGVRNHSLEIIEVCGSDKVIYQVSKWNAHAAESSSFGGIVMSVLEQHSNGKWLTNSHVWNIKS
ncbi:MAG: DUF4440 domain-containing protein [Methylotenera sp.]|nr:DUF4440 domain-containing protein [Methylotenera sp.]